MSYYTPLDTSFLGYNNTLIWGKNTLTSLLNALKTFKSQATSESQERCFVEFDLEIEQAIRTFLEDIKSLRLIVNCRTKADNNEHFGGFECAKLARAFRRSCKTYMHNTVYHDNNEGSIYDFISKVREKAKNDEETAKTTEQELSEKYNAMGIDETMQKLQSYGYTGENLEVSSLANTN